MGGQNPQDMMKRGMPMLGQVPGAVKKGPLGQLHKDTSELIQSTQKDQSQQQIDSVITPDEQSFIDAQKVDEQLAQQTEYEQKQIVDETFGVSEGHLDATITDKEFLAQKINEHQQSTEQTPWASIDSELIHLQNAYRSMMITEYKKLHQKGNTAQYINEAKWKKMDLADLQDEIEIKNEIVKFGKPIALTHYGTVSEEKLKDKMYLAQQLKHLDPFLGPWDEEAQKTWAAEKSNVPLSNLQGYLKEELIKKLKDYFEGTTYLSESPFWASKPLNEIVETYNKMVADKKAGGPLKKLTTVTNPVDKPEEVSPLKKLAQSRLGLGAKLIENIPVAKALQALKKVREAVKKVRYLKKNRELQKANIERKRRAEEDFGDYGFKLGDVQKHLTRAAEIPKMRTVTKEQLEKENAPDEWDTEEVSGPFNVQRRTREEKALDDKFYNHPVLKDMLSRDTNTRENRAIRRLELKKLGDGYSSLSDEQKEYLIERFDKEGTITEADVDFVKRQLRSRLGVNTALRGPDVRKRRSGEFQEAARRIRSEGRIPKYRIPIFDSEGNVIVDEKTPGAFQRYPKKIWQHGRFQRPETAPSGAVYSSDSVLTSSKAAQGARWPSESIADIDDWEATYGMDWETFTEKYVEYKKDPQKFLEKLYPGKYAGQTEESVKQQYVEALTQHWKHPNAFPFGREKKFSNMTIEELKAEFDGLSTSEIRKVGHNFKAPFQSHFEKAVTRFDEIGRSLQGNVAAQAMVFRGPIWGREPHLHEKIGTLPDEVTIDEYKELMEKASNFDYSSLGDIDVKLARDIMMNNIELAYTDFQSLTVPSSISESVPSFKKEGSPSAVSEYADHENYPLKKRVFKKNKTIDRHHLDDLKASRIATFKNITLPRWGDFERMSTNKAGKSEHRYQETIKALGFTGAKVGDEAGTSTAMIDMTAIRAPWAKFDPKKKGSANILASILAGAIVTKAQLKRLQKEGAPHKRSREKKPKSRKRGQHGKRTRVR